MLGAESADARARRVHDAEARAYNIEHRKYNRADPVAISEADEQRVREWREAHSRLDNAFILATTCSFVVSRVKRLLRNFDGSCPCYAHFLAPEVSSFKDALIQLDNDFERLSHIALEKDRYAAMYEVYYASELETAMQRLLPWDASHRVMEHLNREYVRFAEVTHVALRSAEAAAEYFGWKVAEPESDAEEPKTTPEEESKRD